MEMTKADRNFPTLIATRAAKGGRRLRPMGLFKDGRGEGRYLLKCIVTVNRICGKEKDGFPSGMSMTFLRWLLFQTTLMVTLSIMHGVVSPVTYIETACLSCLITVVVELIFIFTWKLKVDFKIKNTAKTYLSYVLMGIGLCLFHGIIVVLFPQIGISIMEQVGLEGLYDRLDIVKNPFTFIYGCIGAPILEEILFRGKILNELLKKYKPAYCIVIAAFLFGLTHINLMQFVNGFGMGLLCGVVYVKTKDIKAPIIIHLVNNTYSMIMALPIESYETYTISIFRQVSSYVLGFVLLLLGLYIFYKEKIRNKSDSFS